MRIPQDDDTAYDEQRQRELDEEQFAADLLKQQQDEETSNG